MPSRHDLDIPFSLQREGGIPMLFGTLTLNGLEYGNGAGEWSNTKWLSGEVNVQLQARLAAKARGGLQRMGSSGTEIAFSTIGFSAIERGAHAGYAGGHNRRTGEMTVQGQCA
jgi:hypothetical protein